MGMVSNVNVKQGLLILNYVSNLILILFFLFEVEHNSWFSKTVRVLFVQIKTFLGKGGGKEKTLTF